MSDEAGGVVAGPSVTAIVDVVGVEDVIVGVLVAVVQRELPVE